MYVKGISYLATDANKENTRCGKLTVRHFKRKQKNQVPVNKVWESVEVLEFNHYTPLATSTKRSGSKGAEKVTIEYGEDKLVVNIAKKIIYYNLTHDHDPADDCVIC